MKGSKVDKIHKVSPAKGVKQVHKGWQCTILKLWASGKFKFDTCNNTGGLLFLTSNDFYYFLCYLLIIFIICLNTLCFVQALPLIRSGKGCVVYNHNLLMKTSEYYYYS